MSFQMFLKPSNRRGSGLIVAATAVTGAIAVYGISQFRLVDKSSSPQPSQTAPLVKKVTALGRLKPESELIRLAAPLSLDGDRVAQLLMKEGDRVASGQIIAILDSHARLQDALRQATEQVKVAQTKLAQVKAGAKVGEIQAQQATIARLQAELEGEVAAQNATIARWQSEVSIARADYDRFQQLYRQGALSASNLDSKRLASETAQAQLNEAKAIKRRTAETLRDQLSEARATLSEIVEVRPVDIQAAQAEVKTAMANAKRAQTELTYMEDGQLVSDQPVTTSVRLSY